jgi:hypothetical protein
VQSPNSPASASNNREIRNDFSRVCILTSGVQTAVLHLVSVWMETFKRFLVRMESGELASRHHPSF